MLITLLLPFLTIAAELRLNPGESVTILPNVSTTISCGGSSVQASCDIGSISSCELSAIGALCLKTSYEKGQCVQSNLNLLAHPICACL